MKTLPMLNGQGWLTDPKEIFSNLFAHALLTDKSQSVIYNGSISSIQYVIARYENSPTELTSQLKTMLETYYSRYFDKVSAVVTDESENLDVKYDVTITIQGNMDGTTYDLGATATISNGILSGILIGVNK